MADVLHISERVITGEILAARHGSETQVGVDTGAVLTPTAWDYIRRHRLTVDRGYVPEPAQAAASSEMTLETTGPESAGAQTAAPEADAPSQVHPPGRCERPHQPFGCRTDEFGSGFAEPASCTDCPIHARFRQGDTSCSCEGCNRHRHLEELVRQGRATPAEELVREITARIGGE